MYEECLIHLRCLLQMLEEEYTDIAHSLQGELLDSYRSVLTEEMDHLRESIQLLQNPNIS